MPTDEEAYEEDYAQAYAVAEDHHFHDPHAFAETAAQTSQFLREIRRATRPIRRPPSRP